MSSVKGFSTHRNSPDPSRTATRNSPPKTPLSSRRFVLTLALLATTLTPLADASVWYVNKASPATAEDGHSWGTPFKTIQPALDAASNDGGGEVWVAKGVYDEARPSIDPLLRIGSGALLIRAASSIYGGFSGTESDLTQRDWNTNLTVIDGATARGGSNAYRVVETAANIVLDGFSIRGGNANGERGNSNRGGGIFVSGSGVVVRNCTIEHNKAQQGGGGVWIDERSSGARFTNCRFIGNFALYGGAVDCVDSATFAHCTFTGNGVSTFQTFAGKPIIYACLFQDTEEAIVAGAGSHLSVINSVFSGNHSDLDATIHSRGFVSCDEGCTYIGSLAIYGCTFYNNSGLYAGAIWSEATPITIQNCIFWSNSPIPLAIDVNPPVDVRNCIVQGGYAAGVNILDQDPRFVNAAKGDFRLLPNSPAIDTGVNLDLLAAQFPQAAFDFEDAPRPQLAGYDMGAYEYPPQPTPDVDGSGTVDAIDIQTTINAILGLPTDSIGDINHDGAADATDIQLVINAALSR